MQLTVWKNHMSCVHIPIPRIHYFQYPTFPNLWRMTLTLKETKEDKIKVNHKEKAKQLSIYNSIKNSTHVQHNSIMKFQPLWTGIPKCHMVFPKAILFIFLKTMIINYSAETVLCTVAAIFLSPKPGGTVPSQKLFWWAVASAMLSMELKMMCSKSSVHSFTCIYLHTHFSLVFIKIWKSDILSHENTQL